MRQNAVSIILLSLVLLSSFMTAVVAATDYYKVLGVSRTATEKEIKTAYRKLTRKYHPDRADAPPDASERFMEINRAWEVLGDAEARAVYDRGGAEGVQRHEQQQQQGGPQSPFDFLFGGGGRRDAPRGPSISVTVPVTLRELYEGTTEMVDVRRVARCSHCGGAGADSPSAVKQCHVCGGSGHVTQLHQLGPGFVQRVQSVCSHCGGSGRSITKKCHVCGGAGTHASWDRAQLSVLPGASWGEEIVVEDAGHEVADSETLPGHIVFTLADAGEARAFAREGDNLRSRLVISLKEALLGFTRVIDHLDGHPVTVSAASVTQPETTIVVADEGMPLPGTLGREYGDLLVDIEVQLPEILSREQKAAIENNFA